MNNDELAFIFEQLKQNGTTAQIQNDPDSYSEFLESITDGRFDINEYIASEAFLEIKNQQIIQNLISQASASTYQYLSNEIESLKTKGEDSRLEARRKVLSQGLDDITKKIFKCYQVSQTYTPEKILFICEWLGIIVYFFASMHMNSSASKEAGDILIKFALERSGIKKMLENMNISQEIMMANLDTQNALYSNIGRTLKSLIYNFAYGTNLDDSNQAVKLKEDIEYASITLFIIQAENPEITQGLISLMTSSLKHTIQPEQPVQPDEKDSNIYCNKTIYKLIKLGENLSKS